MTDQHELTFSEIEQYERESTLANGEHAEPERFPRLFNLSVGFTAIRTIRAIDPKPAEYLAIRVSPGSSVKLQLAVADWNKHWEAAQFRRRFYNDEELPAPLRKVAELGDVNAILVPKTRSGYYEYSPIYHLLPRSTLERFGLPFLTAGQWPYAVSFGDVEKFLPDDFANRLSRAWAYEVWRHIDSGTGLSGFSDRDPIKLLAHDLKFWLPAVTEVIQERLRELPIVNDENEAEFPPPLEDGSVLEGALMGRPRMGSDVWSGEEDAKWAIAETVEAAKSVGRLQEILDAIRSNRVEDDFSQRWSHAREDFERQLYGKRRKFKLVFIELEDVTPIVSPESDIIDQIVLSDFMSVIDEKNRQIVMLVTSGESNLSEVGRQLGYANNSAVQKRLRKLAVKAKRHLDLLD
jgi:hypothetical protein